SASPSPLVPPFAWLWPSCCSLSSALARSCRRVVPLPSIGGSSTAPIVAKSSVTWKWCAGLPLLQAPAVAGPASLVPLVCGPPALGLAGSDTVQGCSPTPQAYASDLA